MATLVSTTAICTGGVRQNSNENQSWSLPHEESTIYRFYGNSAYRTSVLAQFLAGN